MQSELMYPDKAVAVCHDWDTTALPEGRHILCELCIVDIRRHHQKFGVGADQLERE